MRRGPSLSENSFQKFGTTPAIHTYMIAPLEWSNDSTKASHKEAFAGPRHLLVAKIARADASQTLHRLSFLGVSASFCQYLPRRLGMHVKLFRFLSWSLAQSAFSYTPRVGFVSIFLIPRARGSARFGSWDKLCRCLIGEASLRSSSKWGFVHTSCPEARNHPVKAVNTPANTNTHQFMHVLLLLL